MWWQYSSIEIGHVLNEIFDNNNYFEKEIFEIEYLKIEIYEAVLIRLTPFWRDRYFYRFYSFWNGYGKVILKSNISKWIELKTISKWIELKTISKWIELKTNSKWIELKTNSKWIELKMNSNWIEIWIELKFELNRNEF